MTSPAFVAATHRIQLWVVLGGLTIGVLGAATGSAEAAARRTFLISPTSFDFGDVHVGTTSPEQVVTITNVSPVDVVVSIAGGAAGQFGGSQNCQSQTLSPGESCQIFYAFTPSAVGPATGSTNGNFNGQSFSFTFAGNGIRRFRISPTAFDFGDVSVGTSSAQQMVNVTNVSSTSAVVSMAGGAAGLFGGVQNCQGVTLTAGASCQIFYRFSPTTVGPATGTTGGSINGQSFALAFKGTGVRAETGDLDGDGKADPAHYRPGTGQWIFQRSSTNYTVTTTIAWGVSTDRPVPGDYDGDGKTDLAVFRPSTGQWLVLTSSSNFTLSTTTSWGNGADKAVPADYDGDGRTDIAVFRPSDGTWYILQSDTGTPFHVQWGNSADVPVRGDFDGDGRTDIAIFRPSEGNWYIIRSSTGTAISTQWGNSSDLTVPADYDGDGKTDVAIFRPSEGNWYIIRSSTGTAISTQWGNSTDKTTPADWDGDGKADVAVYRPSTGTWFVIMSSSGGQLTFVFGNSTDIPIPLTYLGRT
jgi:putative transposon-encoded protein